MGTLKGQNLRIYQAPDPAITHATTQIIGMATNCTITLNTTTEEASDKDVTGMASKPSVVSKGWQVQVESLNVADVATFISEMKAGRQFFIMWDETSTTDNQTREKASFARQGYAYLQDATFTFDNRTNSVKNLTFVGNDGLDTVPTSTAPGTFSGGSYTKGQFVRLFLGSDNTATPASVIAYATALSLHCTLTLEDATTKDTTGEWVVQEPTAFSYDITTTALTRSGDNITSAVGGHEFADLITIYEDGTPVKWQIANVSGDNQRTKGSVIVSGSVILAQLQSNNPNRANSTYTANLTGYGDITVGA